MADGYEPVRDAFAANFARARRDAARPWPCTGTDDVVDLWGGAKNAPHAGRGRPDGGALGRQDTAAVCAPPPRARRRPCSICCTSAASWTWTRRWARTGRSSRRTARNGCSYGICSRTGPGCPRWTAPAHPGAGRRRGQRPAPRWPPRRPLGSRARPTATTRTPTAGCSANWCGGPRAGRWAAGSRRRSPGRSASTCGSGSPSLAGRTLARLGPRCPTPEPSAGAGAARAARSRR